MRERSKERRKERSMMMREGACVVCACMNVVDD